jgi:uncharacterized cupredoxin-like copper-binding protein
MMKSLTAVTVVLGLTAAMSAAAAHEQFSAGEPGDPKQPARVVKVIMREDGKKMLFEPAYITVHKGEQIRCAFTSCNWLGRVTAGLMCPNGNNQENS